MLVVQFSSPVSVVSHKHLRIIHNLGVNIRGQKRDRQYVALKSIKFAMESVPLPMPTFTDLEWQNRVLPHFESPFLLFLHLLMLLLVRLLFAFEFLFLPLQ